PGRSAVVPAHARPGLAGGYIAAAPDGAGLCTGSLRPPLSLAASFFSASAVSKRRASVNWRSERTVAIGLIQIPSNTVRALANSRAKEQISRPGKTALAKARG